MILHFLFEAFYLIYPYLFVVASFPLRIFSLLEPFFTAFDFGASPWFSLILMSFFPALGSVFTLQIFIKTRNWWKNTSIRLSRSKSLLTFATAYLITAGIIALQYFFSTTLLVTFLIESNIFVPFLILGMIGLGSIFYYFFGFALQAIFKRIEYLQKHSVARGAFLLFLLTLGIYPFFLTTMLMTELFIDPLGNPQASRFFVVNAAIKNTCFIDPTRTNCPQTLEEIGYIEPAAYQDLISGTQVIYTYDPSQNQYTLIVRYSPLKAVIFDWRLVEQYTIDFHDYEVRILGKDRVVDPPSHLGEIIFPEWSYIQ